MTQPRENQIARCTGCGDWVWVPRGYCLTCYTSWNVVGRRAVIDRQLLTTSYRQQVQGWTTR